MPKSNAEKPCSLISDSKVVLLLSRIRPASKGLSGSWISFPVESMDVTGNLQHKHHNCKLIHMDPLELHTLQCAIWTITFMANRTLLLVTIISVSYSSLFCYVLMRSMHYEVQHISTKVIFHIHCPLSSQHQHSFLKIGNSVIKNKLNSIVITILDIMDRPVFYL
jgi:hypothetical protein